MKAIVTTKYGSPEVLRLREVEKPVPQDHEVLVKVKAASVNAGDWRLLRADPFLVRLMFGLFKPKHSILGIDIAGVVEAVGPKVRLFKPGDAVIGDLTDCGFGAFAEYTCASEEALVHKPATISFEEAAAIPTAAVTALQGLRDLGRLQSGQKVLIHGASGGVGTFAIQLAKEMGAEVTAVGSTAKLAMLRELGADWLIDYTKEDFTRTGQRYHLILDAAGFRPLSDFKRILKPKGVYVLVGGAMSHLLQILLLGRWLSEKRGQQFASLIMKPRQKDLEWVAKLLEAGKIKAVIDRSFPLAEVPEAFRYLEERKVQGKVVISPV